MARLRMLSSRIARHDTRTALPPVKQPDPHYSSRAHRNWRAAVIARAGHACQRCGRRGGRLFADHVVELRDGGAALDVTNGQALCAACHTTKTVAARATRMRG
jgi:5-methylcytosine-specific restriction endonuclease McrA